MAALSKILRSSGRECVSFWCPGCKSPHTIPVQPRSAHGWRWNEDAEKPTFDPSLGVNQAGRYHVPSYPTCHSFVRAGRIEYLTDSTHELAGKTVDIPEWPADFHDGDPDDA